MTSPHTHISKIGLDEADKVTYCIIGEEYTNHSPQPRNFLRIPFDSKPHLFAHFCLGINQQKLVLYPSGCTFLCHGNRPSFRDRGGGMSHRSITGSVIAERGNGETLSTAASPTRLLEETCWRVCCSEQNAVAVEGLKV